MKNKMVIKERNKKCESAHMCVCESIIYLIMY